MGLRSAAAERVCLGVRNLRLELPAACVCACEHELTSIIVN